MARHADFTRTEGASALTCPLEACTSHILGKNMPMRTIRNTKPTSVSGWVKMAQNLEESDTNRFHGKPDFSKNSRFLPKSCQKVDNSFDILG